MHTLRFTATFAFNIFNHKGRKDTAKVAKDLSIYNSRAMDLGLKGKVAMVAASSLGFATAVAFAAEGCKVAMCARNEQALARAAEGIRKHHSAEVFACALDVTDAAAVRQFVEAVVLKFDAADICVTNAGGPPAKGFLAASVEDWRKAIDAITLTSITTKQPLADLVLSNAVRAAVVGLVKSLANEFGKDGILVNNVAPGFTATDRLKELARSRSAAAGTAEKQILEEWTADAPLRRLGEPAEVADTIVWLASDRASYVTGQTVLVDGGMYKGL